MKPFKSFDNWFSASQSNLADSMNPKAKKDLAQYYKLCDDLAAKYPDSYYTKRFADRNVSLKFMFK